MSKLNLKQIKNYIIKEFPFEYLQIEPTEEFLDEFACEIRVILNESNCQTIEQEWYFLSKLVDCKYWKKRCRRQKIKQSIDFIKSKKFIFSLK